MLALKNYESERQVTKYLPEMNAIRELHALAENGLGVAAFENGKMTGFLCCTNAFDNAFRATDVKGVFSPMGGHAAVCEKRAELYASMYQAAAEKWVGSGAVSHAICLYSHDYEIQRQFFRYGFGLRCVDAIRPMEPINCQPCAGYEYRELAADEYTLVYPLHIKLNEHYRNSPFFMNRTPESLHAFTDTAANDKGRFFAAFHNGKLCAYLKTAGTGETFAAEESNYRHIRGAFCLSEHRGKGMYQNLLNYVISVHKAEGYTRLGVDFESFNPSARGFYLKYFLPYTYSVVRRIDERILLKNELHSTASI